MSERKWAAANGQEITEEMVGRWCDAYERGEFPECERTVGGVVHGRPGIGADLLDVPVQGQEHGYDD